jgi:hypothetical protein
MNVQNCGWCVIIVWCFFTTSAHSLVFMDQYFEQIYLNIDFWNHLLVVTLLGPWSCYDWG